MLASANTDAIRRNMNNPESLGERVGEVADRKKGSIVSPQNRTNPMTVGIRIPGRPGETNAWSDFYPPGGFKIYWRRPNPRSERDAEAASQTAPHPLE